MPHIPKGKRRPWIPKDKPFERLSRVNDAFYNSKAWREASAAFKRQHPLCINFDEYHGASAITDHIVPIRDGGAVWDVDNWQALCIKCNARKTGAQSKRKRGGG